MNHHSKREGGKLMSRQEAAEYLHISLSTAKRYETRGILKAIRVGPRLVRYREEDVLAIARGN